MPESDIDRVLKILEKNEDKNFVKRILNPEEYPVLDSVNSGGRLEKGWIATHQMTWDEVEDKKGKKKYRVYPNIVMRDNALHWFDEDGSAGDYASESKEFIEFDNPEDADWFSQNYKLIWDH